MTWLIGAKIICCGALLLVLTGAVSLGTVAAVVAGKAGLIAGGGAVALVAAAAWHLRRSGAGPDAGMRRE